MLRPKSTLLLATLLVLAPASLRAWVSVTATSTDPAPAHWDLANAGTAQQEVSGGKVIYRLHGAGSDDVLDGSDLEAVRNAFASWQGVPDAVIAYEEGPEVATKSIDNDHVFPVFWDEAGQFPIGGALAVTFTYIITSGPEKGEIVDTNIVFNGSYEWATDGRAGAYDIESVAAHEIGHSLGLDHTPLGSATMWPFTSAGDTSLRSLSEDDVSAVTAKYPGAGVPAQTGDLEGYVSEAGGGLLHGAHVVVTNEEGGVVAATLSQADGSFRIPALPPDDYRVHVETIGTPRFSTTNLGDYWTGADTGFRASFDPVPLTVVAGQTTIQDLIAPVGGASIAPRWVGRSDVGVWTSSAVRVEAGEGLVEVGLAAENMPTTGSPLSVSGSDLPVVSTRFGTVGGHPAALITLDLTSSIEPGHRSFIVEVGGERARSTASLEVLPAPSVPDADGDTVSDDDEGAPGLDTDGDGTPDYLDLDADGDTIADADEAGDGNLDTAPVDTDGDTIPDLRDPDADGDAISDAEEAGDADPSTPPVDTDTDGVPDFLDLDSDGDGISDLHEAGDDLLVTLPSDTDADGVADYRDRDSDGDTIGDRFEAGDDLIATPPVDTDGDGTPDFRDDDSDGDTIADLHDGHPAGLRDPELPPSDTDGDGTPDFRDDDSDGDTIPDAVEAGDADLGTPPVDTDGTGGADFRDVDADDDSVLDAWEAGDADPATAPRDSDGDTVPDYLDPDSDGDGLADLDEAGDADPNTPPVDTDGDGIPDLLDLDSDDDGVEDGLLHETTDDFDGDGRANFRDADADGGGEPDGSEVGAGRDPLDPSDDDPTAVPPGEVPDGSTGVEPFRVERSGQSGLAFTWSAAGDAVTYRVYRGSLGVLSTGNLAMEVGGGGGTCDTGGALSHQDALEVGEGPAAAFYLVVGVNSSGEGSAGSDSSGNPRPQGSGCGTL